MGVGVFRVMVRRLDVRRLMESVKVIDDFVRRNEPTQPVFITLAKMGGITGHLVAVNKADRYDAFFLSVHE